MGLPTWRSPKQMPRPYEVGKVQFIPGFHQAGKIGAVGGSSTTRIRQNFLKNNNHDNNYHYYHEKQERLGKVLPLGPDKILGRRKRD